MDLELTQALMHKDIYAVIFPSGSHFLLHAPLINLDLADRHASEVYIWPPNTLLVVRKNFFNFFSPIRLQWSDVTFALRISDDWMAVDIYYLI